MPKRAVALLALELGSATAERIILGWKKCNALQGDEVQLDGSPLRQERRGLLLPFQRRGRPGPLAQCTAVDFRVTSTSAARTTNRPHGAGTGVNK